LFVVSGFDICVFDEGNDVEIKNAVFATGTYSPFTLT
jgi:hypothetical protein